MSASSLSTNVELLAARASAREVAVQANPRATVACLVAGDMIAVLRGAAHREAEHVRVEFCGFLDIVNLQRQMHDARLRAALTQLIAADIDELRHAAVGRAELERAFLLVGED